MPGEVGCESNRAWTGSLSRRAMLARGRAAGSMHAGSPAAAHDVWWEDIMHSRSHVIHTTIALLVVLGACTERPTAPARLPSAASADRDQPGQAHRVGKVRCDADNAGITLPPGFCALVVADLVEGGQPAQARHMAVTPNGDLFVAINSPNNQNPPFGIIGLRDRDGDGHADEQSRFSPGLGGSGIAWDDGRLFFGANDRVLRFRLPAGSLTPTGNADVVVRGLPNTGDHIS